MLVVTPTMRVLWHCGAAREGMSRLLLKIAKRSLRFATYAASAI